MKGIVHQAPSVLQAHEALAGPVLGLIAWLEGLAVIGVFVPATPLIVLLGAAIASGQGSPWLLPWCMGGAFGGAWTSFEAGRLARRRSSSQTRAALLANKARPLFLRYGDLAIVVGRFTGVTAGLGPFAAGYLAMGRRRFALACILTSVSWPLVMAAVGYAGSRQLGALIHSHVFDGAELLAASAILVGVVLGSRRLAPWRRHKAVRTPGTATAANLASTPTDDTSDDR